MSSARIAPGALVQVKKAGDEHRNEVGTITHIQNRQGGPWITVTFPDGTSRIYRVNDLKAPCTK